MKIDQAGVADREEIFAMLREYQQASPLLAHKTVNEETAIRMVDLILHRHNGIILLSRDNDKITGMIVALFTMNLWDTSIRYMAELAYWVRPEHRGSSAAYRLIRKYKEIGDLLIQQREIEYYTISKMVNSPDLNYEKFGFKPLEGTWICQAV